MVELIKIISGIKKNIILVICLSVLITIPFIIRMEYIIYILTMCLIFSIAAVGWNVGYGYAGLLSFGHNVFYGIAGYICVLLFKWYDVTPWIGLIIGPMAASLLGMFIAWLTTRSRGLYFSLTTSILPLLFKIFFTWNLDVGGGFGLTLPFKGENWFYMQSSSRIPYYFLSLAVLVLCMIGIKILDASKLGHYLKALGRDEEASESIGISASRMKLYGMGISAFICGLSGVIYANFIHFIDPYEAFGQTANLYFILATMFGGVGTMIGPALGSFILIPLSELLKFFLEQRFGTRMIGVHFIIYGLILMTVIVKMPFGVYPKIKNLLIKKGLLAQ